MHIFNIMILLKIWRVIIKQKYKIGVLISLKYTKYFFWAIVLWVNNLSAVCFTWHSFCHSVIPCIKCVCLLNYIKFLFTLLYHTSVPCAVNTGTGLLWVYSNIYFCSAYFICGVSLHCPWLLGFGNFIHRCAHTPKLH